MSGVSARTLRYYDEIGLLIPVRVASSGYRIYGSREVDRLQQILLYRELEFPLEDIKKMLDLPDFDREQAFLKHLAGLRDKRRRIDEIIDCVAKSIAAMKGETIMTDNEKFEGFKQNLIDENERKYGCEVREKYGHKAVDESNDRLKNMTKQQFEEAEALRIELEEILKEAFATGNPAGPAAQKACELHKNWLCIFAPYYCREYHMALGEMYVADDRFRANYDKIAPGCTEFLRDAINIFCNK